MADKDASKREDDLTDAYPMAYRYLSATKTVGNFADAGRYRSLICLDHYPPGVNFTMPHVQAS